MPDPVSFRIELVTTKQHLRDFLDLPKRLYQNDPSYVHPLRSMSKQLIDDQHHPFYQHATRALWLCYQGDQPAGRIAAIKDDLHNEYYNDSVGFFGFLEFINDSAVLDLLLNTAEAWLRERECTSMRGPVSPSMKGEFGVLTVGHEFPPYIMMGHSLNYYDEAILAAGFDVAKQFFAFRIHPGRKDAQHKIHWERLEKAEAKILRRYPQLHFREVEAATYEQTLREISILGNDVRRHGFGFVPMTDAELQFMIDNLRRVIRFDMIHVAYWDDQLVGFIVNIPDINWVLGKARGRWDWLRMIQMPYWIKRCPRSRVIAIGVHEEFRKKGIAIMLIKRLTDIWFNYDEWEFSWVAEDNQKSIGAINSVIDLDKYKTYRLYERAIA